MTKKKVFVIALAVALVAILSMGTLAWFTGTDSVTNNFLIADSNDDGVADFSVDVKESDDEGATWTDGGLEFSNILPGETVSKLAVVKNTSSNAAYSQYIRVTVKVVGAPQWTSAVLGADLKNSLGIDETVWTVASTTYDDATKTNTMVLYLNDVLAQDASVTVFEEVEIPSAFVNDANSVLNLADFSITVQADAIQSENLGLTTPGAAAAFDLLD